MSDDAARLLDQLRQEARTRWDYPFKRETLDVNLCIAFTTRGNDSYWAQTQFLLNQMNIFKRLSVLTAISMWGPGAEHLFKLIGETPFDYVLVVDSDVAPTDETPVRMIERNLDIVSCPTVMYDGANQDIHYNLHRDGNFARVYWPEQAGRGLEKISNTSWTCVLMRHRVFEMFLQQKESFTKWSELLSEDFKELPPDSMFFEKCKVFGFDIYMDWDLEMATHHKYVALNGVSLEKFVARRLWALDQEEHERRAVHVLGRRTSSVRP